MFDFSRLASWSTWDVPSLSRRQAAVAVSPPDLWLARSGSATDSSWQSWLPWAKCAKHPKARGRHHKFSFCATRNTKFVKQHVENTWPRLWKSSWKSPYLEDFRAAGLETQILFFLKHKFIIIHWCHLQIHIRNPKNLHCSFKKTQRLSKTRKGWGNPNLQHHRVQVHLPS